MEDAPLLVDPNQTIVPPLLIPWPNGDRSKGLRQIGRFVRITDGLCAGELAIIQNFESSPAGLSILVKIVKPGAVDVPYVVPPSREVQIVRTQQECTDPDITALIRANVEPMVRAWLATLG